MMLQKQKGSEGHFLDWVECPDFTEQLTCLLPTGAIVKAKDDRWILEAHLEHLKREFVSQLQVDWNEIWNEILVWWLAKRAPTPKWDLISTCDICGQKGLVLVEGKAHVNELKEYDRCRAGKENEGLSEQLRKTLTKNNTAIPIEVEQAAWTVRDENGNILYIIEKNSGSSLNIYGKATPNYVRIGKALDEAGEALSKITGKQVNITHKMRHTHFQLANRVAFSWKIASMGVPVILVYLGFLRDKTLGDEKRYPPFENDNDWKRELRKYMGEYIPCSFTEKWQKVGKSKMQMIVRSLPVG